METKTLCTGGCGREIGTMDMFSNGMCVDCYEERYEAMSDGEKVPDFTNEGLVNL